MVKNIVFDIGNVLVKFNWSDFMKSLGIVGDDFERLANATVRDPDWNEIDRGILSDDEVLQLFIENDPEMESVIRYFYRDFKGLLKKFDYTNEWIKDLKARGYRVYCLSNMSYKAVRECTDVFDFLELLDGFILSCDVKLIKPDSAIYHKLFEKYDLVPEDSVFIDDLFANVEAAKRTGMKGIVFEGVDRAEELLKEM